jgi:S-adenosylmethionine synthetase
VRYENDKPTQVEAVVVSSQHSDRVEMKELRHAIMEEVIHAVIPPKMLRPDTQFHINPTGRFVTGGPMGDSGLTGRKIIVDTYGGMGHHGGGAFSGKDPSKVDRSACYMARHIAKNIVAAGAADRCEVQLAYAIGVAEPVSVMVETFGTGAVAEEKLVRVVRDIFPLTPLGIIDYLKLRRPIYEQTAAYGHFGRREPGFTWELTNKAEEVRQAAGLSSELAEKASARR